MNKISSINYVSRPDDYLCREVIMERFHMGRSAVDTRLREIRSEIERGRYPEKAIIKDGGFSWVNYYVWLDYLHNRTRLKEKNARKYAPAFNTREWKELCADEVREEVV